MILSYPVFIRGKNNRCWNGYAQIATKKKRGKKAPNCVKANGELEEFNRTESYLDYYRNPSTPKYKVDRYRDSIIISVHPRNSQQNI